MKILLLDNFDSFTYNLFHYLEALGCEVTVARNNAVSLEKIAAYDKIVLSPGPGLPKDAGIMPQLIDRYITQKPILGVCLGMQAIGEHFGGKLYNQQEVKHGVPEMCCHNGDNFLFAGIPAQIEVGLYHSWAVDLTGVADLKPTAHSENQVLMAFEHRALPVAGVQFHPESILTQYGKEMISNFIRL